MMINQPKEYHCYFGEILSKLAAAYRLIPKKMGPIYGDLMNPVMASFITTFQGHLFPNGLASHP